MLQTLRKKGSAMLIIVLAALVVLSGTAFGTTATPVRNHADSDLNRQLVEWGLIEDGESFDDEKELTYADAVPLLVKSFQLSLARFQFIKAPLASDYFTNVPDDAPYSEDFVIASVNGLDLPRDLEPDALISKEEFTHSLFQAVSTTGDYAFIQIYLMIADEDEVNPEYMNSIQKALIAKFTELDESNKFYPKSNISQGEAVDMVIKALAFIAERQDDAGMPLPDKLPGGDTPVSNDGLNDTSELTYEETAVNEEVKKVTVSWGEKPNSGYRLTIEKIGFADGKATVYVQRHYPEKGKMYLQVITTPTAETFVGSEYEVVLEAASSDGDGSEPVISPGLPIVDEPQPIEPQPMPRSKASVVQPVAK